MRRLALVLLAAGLAGTACGGSSDSEKTSSPTTTATTATSSSQAAQTPAGSLKVTSSAFTDGGAIPAEFTCDGANKSPPLGWTAVPSGTMSLALRMQDIDTSQKFVHWLAYNISPKTTTLAVGEKPPDSIEALNSFNKPGYGGPCPPAGQRHRYVFTLLAQQTTLTVADTQDPNEIWSSLENSAVLAKGELTGTYQRK